MFAFIVPSCCDKSGTNCYHVVTKLMTVTDFIQVVPIQLIHVVCNKLLRACHQLVSKLLRENDTILVGITCCESDS